MLRALQLAQQGRFSVSPNPRVGAVIVHNDKIIGEGYHQQYGKAHAEVNAVASVVDKSVLPESTIFVNLEPCAHHGKTPPCADLLIQHQFKRVVIANKDPFEKVDGNGISKLLQDGIDVSIDCLSEKGLYLNRRFFTFHEKKRPYIILKWAETKDGFISRIEKDIKGDNNWITNEASKQLVHQWRAEEDAILVGKNTVKIDNPALTVREVEGKNPIRFVVDENLELPKHLKVFNEEAQTVVINSSTGKTSGNTFYLKNDARKKLIPVIKQYCFEKQIQSIIIEGGADILTQFIQSKDWDEARVFVGNKYFYDGIKAPPIKGKIMEKKQLGSDELIIYHNNK